MDDRGLISESVLKQDILSHEYESEKKHPEIGLPEAFELSWGAASALNCMITMITVLRNKI